MATPETSVLASRHLQVLAVAVRVFRERRIPALLALLRVRPGGYRVESRWERR